MQSAGSGSDKLLQLFSLAEKVSPHCLAHLLYLIIAQMFEDHFSLETTFSETPTTKSLVHHCFLKQLQHKRRNPETLREITSNTVRLQGPKISL